MIEISPGLSIPLHELAFEVSTATGPGWQHVNRSRTRVTLVFDLERSTSLTSGQKERIRTRLRTRLDRAGRMRVRCGRHRSQAANREETKRRFAGLIRDALRRRRKRVATGPTAAERRRRLEIKRRRARLKQLRRRATEHDD